MGRGVRHVFWLPKPLLDLGLAWPNRADSPLVRRGGISEPPWFDEGGSVNPPGSTVRPGGFSHANRLHQAGHLRAGLLGWVGGWVGRVRWGLGDSCAAGDPCKHLGRFALQVLAGPPSSPRDRRLAPGSSSECRARGGLLRPLAPCTWSGSGGQRSADSKAMSGGFRF